MKLTDIVIRNLKHDEKQVIHFDNNLPNFGVRVSKRYKTFIVILGTNRTVKSIGRYPDMSLAEARKLAKKAIALHIPSKNSLSYQDAKKFFLKEAEQKNRAKTVYEYKRYLHAFDSKSRFEKLTRTEMNTHLHQYKHTPSQYNHALTAFRVFFNWGLREELIEKNPLQGLPKMTTKSRNRVLVPDELREIYHYEYKPFSDIVKLLILLGQRRSETTHIHSDWIQRDTITFPDSITKNRREHTIPFGGLARPFLEGDGNLFQTSNKTLFSGFGKAKRRMDNCITIPHWTLHDLRRTFASTHAMLGTPLHITELLLNHASGSISGVTAVYNRYQYLDEKREAVARYEMYLAEVLNID